MKRVIQQSNLVTVIVPTRNSRRTIEKCLRSIKSQTYPKIETIIADSGSTDGTAEVAEAMGASVCKFPSGAERTVKKNAAANLASGSYLFFVDSDFELAPEVVQECVHLCLEGADAVIIPERVRGNQGFWARCRELEVLSYAGDDNVESPRFFRQGAFSAIGGFDSHLTFGEDNDISLKVREKGFHVSRSRAYLDHHEGPVVSVVARKLYYGRSAQLYFRKRGFAAIKQFSPVRVGWIRNRRLIAKHPLQMIGFLILKLGQYEAVIIGLLIKYFD